MIIRDTLTGIAVIAISLTVVAVRIDNFGWGIGAPHMASDHPATLEDVWPYVKQRYFEQTSNWSTLS